MARIVILTDKISN